MYILNNYSQLFFRCTHQNAVSDCYFTHFVFIFLLFFIRITLIIIIIVNYTYKIEKNKKSCLSFFYTYIRYTICIPLLCLSFYSPAVYIESIAAA